MTDIKQLIERLREEFSCAIDQPVMREAADALDRLTQQPVGVVPVRLADSQWMNIVNHDRAYENYDKEDAVHMAVKLTEARMAKNYAETVARLQSERDTNRHLLDKVSANYDTLFDRNARLQAERDAWKDYAQHQEHCAVCGDSVSDCEEGSTLKAAALAKIEGRG